MKQINLPNGLICVVGQRNHEGLTLSATVKVGHLNEPKLGLAAVYEKVIMLQAPEVATIYGGTITSYLTGGETKDFKAYIEKMAKLVAYPELNEDLLKNAVEDIIRHNRDRNVLPRRQLKLLYKHTAFSGNIVWDTEAYTASLLSLTVEDLQSFHDCYFTGKNIIIGVSGIPAAKILPELEEAFSKVPSGTPQKAELPEYTGGYGYLRLHPTENGHGSFNRVLMGWDISALVNVADANVMMSMLSGRLERKFAAAGIDAAIEVRVAGYYGCRTLRIAVECGPQTDVNVMLDIICANIKRLKTEPASERRMETSRNRAMVEKLLKFQQPDSAAVEISWQILKRGFMYDIADRINNTWRVSARNVMEVSQEIFNDNPTVVVASEVHPAFIYSLEEIVDKMK